MFTFNHCKQPIKINVRDRIAQVIIERIDKRQPIVITSFCADQGDPLIVKGQNVPCLQKENSL